MKNLIQLFLILLLAVSCKDDTSFKGKAKKKERPVVTEDATQKDKNKVEQGTEKVETVPENAVKKGSFTVYTVPAKPFPFQKYNIIIEVNLPDTVKEYTINDISGYMTGTDGFQQGFGSTADKFEKNKFSDKSGYQQKFGFIVGKARLIVPIPGAKNQVKDTIHVTSRIPDKESQKIELVFGAFLH